VRHVYRWEDNADYWDRRWAESGADRDHFEDLTIYPIRYAEMVMTDRSKKALEVGCGLGRVVLHYRRQGFAVSGIERSRIAVAKVRERYPDADVREGDALNLPFPDGAFDVVMAFGVYHNLESGVDTGLSEVSRCLSRGGRFCISMRPDNVEMRLNEVYWRWRNRRMRKGDRYFHKVLVGEREFKEMLAKVGLVTDGIHRARNVSLLYRLPFLRSREATKGSEEARRSTGYRLNVVGRFVDRILCRLFPYHTANVLVFIGHKA
jgi:SAM-dependent methyltransferase